MFDVFRCLRPAFPSKTRPFRIGYRSGTKDCSVVWPEVREMLYTLAVILLIAWLLGMVGTYTIGAFIHVLLVIAIVLFLVGILSGRRTVV
jgi:hypothetical protein